MPELGQVERQGGRRQLEQHADAPGGQTFTPGLNQQPENVEPRLLSEGAQSSDCG
jgi:hypothetical protein